MPGTIACAGCGADVSLTDRICPACNTTVARSRRVRMGKRRLLLSVIIILIVGFVINEFVGTSVLKAPPHPPQVYDTPQ